MSLLGRCTSNVARDACAIVNVFFTLAVDGSFGLSWWAVSVLVTGWLRPKPSASRPARSTVDSNVTSNEPLSPETVCSTCVGDRVPDDQEQRQEDGYKRSTSKRPTVVHVWAPLSLFP
jgi:hypothetical protein